MENEQNRKNNNKTVMLKSGLNRCLMLWMISITYDLIGPRHFDFDPNEACEGENALRPADDGRMVHAENQAD